MKKNRLLALLLTLSVLFGFFSVAYDTQIEADAVGQTNIITWSTPGFYTYTIPRSGIWELECWGARGGDDSGKGGNGSYRSGFFRLEAGTVIRICVGQAGGTGGGLPFNTIGGGGNTGGHGWSGQGGGATYAVTGSSNYLWDYSGNRDAVLIVGGAGGGGTCGVQGGAADVYAGNGVFGKGTNCPSSDGGGGGGGYMGGAGANDGQKTGGGTSYVNTNRGYTGTWSKGTHAGNGMFRISLHGYYIKFDKNTPSATQGIVQGVMPDQYMIFGVPDTLQKNTYTLRGYVWQGWTEFPNGTGEQYEDEQLVVDR